MRLIIGGAVRLALLTLSAGCEGLVVIKTASHLPVSKQTRMHTHMHSLSISVNWLTNKQLKPLWCAKQVIFFLSLFSAEKESFWLAVRLHCLCCMLTASARNATQVAENLTGITRMSRTSTVGQVRTGCVGMFWRSALFLDPTVSKSVSASVPI